MPFEIRATGCCGMQELVDISEKKDPEEVLKSSINELIRWHRPFLIFTGVVKRTVTDHASARLDNYGQAFVDYIKENDLGDVVASRPRKNISGNTLVVWVWTPDWRNLYRWGANKGYLIDYVLRYNIESLPNNGIRD